jgi:hypothetical protein
VTDRDWHVLAWVGEQYAARLDHVQYQLGQDAGRGAKIEGQISQNAARLVVARWKRLGLADYKKILASEPAWIWLTAKGIHELDLSFKFYTPSLARLEHLSAVNRVRIFLEKQHPDAVWYSEREYRADMVYEKGVSFPHIPDGILETEKGDVAIEVELNVKKPAELRESLQELAESYHEVWYFANKEIGAALDAARKKLDPTLAERISIYIY